MENKKIPLIALAIFSMVILITYGNTDKAFALTVTKLESDTTSEVMGAIGYSAGHDYLVAGEVTGGVYHVHVIEGDTLLQVADITTVLTTTSGSAENTNGWPCTASVCFVWGQSGANVPTVIRISLSSLSVVVTYAEVEYAGCSITNLEQSGTSLYATMADLGGCPYTGIYQLSSGFSTDVASNIQWVEYDNTSAFGDTNHIRGSCLSNQNFITATATLVRKYNLSTKTLTSSASLGSTNAKIDCDGSHVYVSMNGVTDGIRRVNIATMTVESDTNSLSNPNDLMVRGDTLYVFRSDGQATITALDKSDLTSGFTFYTAEDDDGHFFKGNSTRFNALTSGGSNDNIFYAFEGILDTDAEEEEDTGTGLEGVVNGVCVNVDANGDGIINVLDCVGETTAFGSFNSGRNITDVTQTFTDGFGITNCGDNPDVENCGSGLFTFLFLLILTEFLILAGYLGFTKLANADRQIVDVALILLIGGIADLAIAWTLNWIPDIYFYTVIILVSGFFAFGLLTRLRS